LSINIQIERFEGPLGLLLHLIRKDEMDILDINIYNITGQYLEYIKVMKKLDLELAGEFIAMAATLIHIKSKMLLPQYDEDGEEIECEDPRRELVQRLLEYQKFKEASHKLYERPLLGRDCWVRGTKLDVGAPKTEEEIIVEENALFALIKSYRAALKSMKTSVHNVMSDLQTIAARLMEIKDRLVIGRSIYFKQLITAEGESYSGQVLITFLSMLELAKMGFVSLFQADNFSDIHIKTINAVDGDVITRSEEFDGDYSLDEGFSPDNDIIADMDDEFPESEEQPALLVQALQYSEQEAPFEEDAATDEEIEKEEALLNLTPQNPEGELS